MIIALCFVSLFNKINFLSEQSKKKINKEEAKGEKKMYTEKKKKKKEEAPEEENVIFYTETKQSWRQQMRVVPCTFKSLLDEHQSVNEIFFLPTTFFSGCGVLTTERESSCELELVFDDSTELLTMKTDLMMFSRVKLQKYQYYAIIGQWCKKSLSFLIIHLRPIYDANEITLHYLSALQNYLERSQGMPTRVTQLSPKDLSSFASNFVIPSISVFSTTVSPFFAFPNTDTGSSQNDKPLFSRVPSLSTSSLSSASSSVSFESSSVTFGPFSYCFTSSLDSSSSCASSSSGMAKEGYSKNSVTFVPLIAPTSSITTSASSPPDSKKKFIAATPFAHSSLSLHAN